MYFEAFLIRMLLFSVCVKFCCISKLRRNYLEGAIFVARFVSETEKQVVGSPSSQTVLMDSCE